MNNEDSISYWSYVNLHNNYIEDVFNKSLQEINLPVVYNQAKELERMESNVIIPLARKYMMDSVTLNDYISDLNFGKARNSYMAQKVINIVSNQSGKK